MEKSYYIQYFSLEREHWWFKARLKILGFIIEKKLYKNTPVKILNAGAATGATSIMLTEYGEVLSLEYNEPCAEYLSEILNEKICTASLTDIPIGNGTFDLVCAFDVIEHIPNLETFLKEQVIRILKPGGMLIFQTPNKYMNIIWEIINQRSLSRWKTYHCSLQTNTSLIKNLESSGFSNIVIQKGNILTKHNKDKIRKKLSLIGLPLLVVLEKLPLCCSPNIWGTCKK